jgi:chromosome segregation ATPase
VAQLNAAAQASEDALNATLNETKAELVAEQAKTSKLEIEIQDTVARMDELKLAADESSELLVAEKGTVSQLEADLAAVTATVDSSHQQALDAENQRDLMEMEKIETQRRFDMLRAALLDLNKKNPEDLQIKLIVDDMGGTPAATESITESAPAASEPESVKGLLDEMDNM